MREHAGVERVIVRRHRRDAGRSAKVGDLLLVPRAVAEPALDRLQRAAVLGSVLEIDDAVRSQRQIVRFKNVHSAGSEDSPC